MKTVPLKSVAEIIMGTAPPGNSYNTKGDGLPLIAGAGDYGEVAPNPKKWTTAPTSVSEKGDLIVGVRASIGDLNWSDRTYCLGRGVAGLRVTDNYDIKLLAYYIDRNKELLSRNASGSTFRAIRRSHLEEFQVPDIPIADQKRIASILDKADAIRRKRRESIKLLDDLLRSTFLDMFGDPVTNPKRWEVVKSIEVCDCIVPGRDKPKSFTGDIPWITTDDLIMTDLTFESKTNLGLTSREIAEVNARIIPAGSVIMTCVGELGITSVAGNDLVMNQQLHAFICSEQVNNFFLAFSLSFQKDHMNRVSNSTTVPYLNKTKCNETPTILPPVELQSEFADVVKRARFSKSLLGKSSIEIDRNFNSLRHHAFMGGL